MKTNGDYLKGTLLTAFIALIGLLATEFASAQDWFDTDWQYRREVTVDNPAGTVLTDFQVMVTLDGSFDFSKANADGSDIRFTSDDGTTLIPYWFETWEPATPLANIWVKVPDIPIPGSKIYMYYGNPTPDPDPVEYPPEGPFTKHVDNPIVPAGDSGNGEGLLAENIVYDSVTGHYWMVFAIYRGSSAAGLAWSDTPDDPNSWNWHGSVITSANAPHLIENNGTWYIFYADRAHGGPPYPISVASSSTVNGTYTYIDKVLEVTEAWEAYRVDEPYVFQRTDGKWIMMYMGDAGSTVEQVGYAEADDILGPYTKFAGNPCLAFGPSGSYDAGTIADPWVYEFGGTYYIGYTVSPTISSPWQTALATTTDWVTFTKQGVLLPLGDEFNSFRGAVTRVNDTYVFSYTTKITSGGPYQMAIATQPVLMPPQPDPVEVPPEGPYTKDPDNPIVPTGDPQSGTSLLAENIVYDNVTGKYWMVFANYRSSSYGVGLVWSYTPNDPNSWNWHGNVYTQAGGGSFAPHIIKEGGLWYIFFAQLPNIVYMTSATIDGTYSSPTVVLNNGAPGTWDDYRADEPYVFQRNDGKWIMIYMGDAGSVTEQVGYAEADAITGPYTKFAGNPCIAFGPPGSYDAGTIADPWVYEYYGEYYIGYTVSPTSSSPWQTALATTSDWVNFTKHGVILPLGGEFDSFRGAVTRIDDEYVFSYTTKITSGSSYQMAIATQPVFMALPSTVNNGNAVFDFFDDFDGTSIDETKWTFTNGSSSQANVGSGLLTLHSPSISEYVKIQGQSSFGMEYRGETYGYHPDQGAENMIAETGFADASWNTIRIVDDFPSITHWQREAKTSGQPEAFFDMAQLADTDWHTFSVFRESPDLAGFQIDNNAVETTTSDVPTMALPPFLMSYGNGNDFVIDWTRVRKWAGADATTGVGDEQSQNDNIDIAIYNTTCGDFEVKLRPNSDITDSYLTNIQFTVKWPYNTVNLTDFSSGFGVALQGSVIVENDTNYAVFISTANIPVTWTAQNEYTILSFSHDHSATGNADFLIDTSGWASTNNGVYYVELLGHDYTGIVYGNATDVYLGRCGNLRVLLQGPYAGGGMMSKGLEGNIPLSQPYGVPPWNYSGTETVTVMDTSAVDWVLVELRSDISTSVEKKAALLLDDGKIVQYNNTSHGVYFDNTPNGSSYYIVVFHRNHMPVMTLESTVFDGSIVDFTDETICYGTPNAEIELETGIYGLIAGDINSNGYLSYSGPGNDRGLVLARIVQEENTTNINDTTLGYFDEDVLMDYQVKYIGTNNDRAIMLPNLATLTGTPYLNAVYQSLVPGVATKSGSINQGPVNILLDETDDELQVNITTDEVITGGIVDNVQFTLSWEVASNDIVVPVLENAQSSFGIMPQGEAVEYQGKMYQVFVSVVPVDLPGTFSGTDEVVLVSFTKDKPVDLENVIHIADNAFTQNHNGGFYISILGKDFTGTIHTASLDIADIQDAGLSIYPNPVTSGIIHVEMNLVKAQDVTITVMDVHGKVVASQALPVNEGVSDNQVDLHHLSKGIYYIKVQADNLNAVRKLILL